MEKEREGGRREREGEREGGESQDLYNLRSIFI